MAANLLGLTNVTAENAIDADIAVAASALVAAPATNHIIKINSLIVANIDGSNDATVTVYIYRSSTIYYIAKTITVPKNASLVVISKDAMVYLQSGDALYIAASVAGDLSAVCSFEDLS